MHQLNASEIIEHLQLIKHPEGGYYRELYRSNENIAGSALPERYTADRVFSTSIYFMLTDRDSSAFHRIKSDEIWHYYTGQSLSLYQIDRAGKLYIKKLGLDFLQGELPQILIERETYFGAKVNGPGYCLMGCTVAPGFDFNDFEMPKAEELLRKYPEHEKIIRMLS